MRHIYADFIDQVAKPTRYLGGEYLSADKDLESVSTRVVLAFPDVYEVGMSHMGTKILYSILNKHDSVFAERCFTPWPDLESEIRKAELPLVSLETQTPLSEFDVVGFSLQYELTYSNVLTMLDLGGIPILSKDRADSDPLIIGGGPCATHPEPMAEFFDAFFVGEAEEQLVQLSIAWAAMRKEGVARREALILLASDYSLYVPSLYELVEDDATKMLVVGKPLDKRVPRRVRRAMVENIDDYPFPSDTPVPYAEAVFDRAGVEIARGCTEGCRFCQAGMIYRPVRERSPESIVESLMNGVDKAGYDETSLTCLSTADYSSITPLVKEVMSKLKPKKVSLSVSSLRAYGLGEEILDEMASMRITGLTFAPEAGTQRMRDVVNKNVTEAHIEESTHRIFERGWNRLKLYFMIGLPTEEDEDVQGIVQTGERMLKIGKNHVGPRAEVTVSVSSHVPKPHTPFQWCAQDSDEQIERKQKLLRKTVFSRNLKLKMHDRGTSLVEGVMSRGDRRLSPVILEAWKLGARFDSWEESFDVDRWCEVFEKHNVIIEDYSGTRPIDARLPWDHIDVGLDDGFLLTEYRRSMKNRLSPPCGKVKGDLIHKTNVADAKKETGKLVCYDCGVACDLSAMRKTRVETLVRLGSFEPAPKREPVRLVSARSKTNKQNHPTVAFADKPKTKFRLTYSKVGRSSFLGHLDTMRVLARLFRRAGIDLAYTRGFHPKPMMSFSPALPLGVASLGEVVDLAVETKVTGPELERILNEVSPEGMMFASCKERLPTSKNLGKLIDGYTLLIQPAPDGIVYDERRLGGIVERFLAKESVIVERKQKKVDVRGYTLAASIVPDLEQVRLAAALDWPNQAMIQVHMRVTATGTAKPREVAEAMGIGGTLVNRPLMARRGFSGLDKPSEVMVATDPEALAAALRA